MTLFETLADDLARIASSVPPALIPPSSWQAWQTFSGQFPHRLSQQITFEVRLHTDSAPVDMSIKVTSNHAGDLARYAPQNHPTWQRIRHFAQRWQREPLLQQHIYAIWLEFDADNPLPSMFISTRTLKRGEDNAWLLQDVLPLLAGEPLANATRQAIQACIHHLPPNVPINGVGLMLARSQADLPVRLVIPLLSYAWSLEYLRRVNWRGNWEALHALFERMEKFRFAPVLNFDVSDHIHDTLGIECAPNTFPRHVRRTRKLRSWDAWGDELAALGLCTPAKRTAMRDFAQIQGDYDLQAGHIKLKVTNAGILEAKGYFHVRHRVQGTVIHANSLESPPRLTSTRLGADMQHELFTFERLIHPITKEQFFAEYWEKKPLLIQRNNPNYYDGLLSLADIDHIIATQALQYPSFRMASKGKDIPLDSYTRNEGGRLGDYPNTLAPDRMYDLYQAGATIILQSLQRHWDPLRLFTRDMMRQFSAVFKTNVYLTPSSSQGFSTHWDTHDVFAIQLEGSKFWRIFDSPFELPLDEGGYDSIKDKIGDPTMAFTLRKGDVLYFPRGWIHDAQTTDELSVHITLGVYPTYYVDILQNIVNLAIDDPRFRYALPLTYAFEESERAKAKAQFHTMLRDFVDSADFGQIIDAFAEQFVNNSSLFTHGQLLSIEALQNLSLNSHVQPTVGVLWRIKHTSEERVALQFHGRELELPSVAENALRWLATHEQPFMVAEIPDFDDDSKLMVVRKLVEQGFLRIVTA